MEMQDSMRKILVTQCISLCLIKTPFQILYMRMYDYMKDENRQCYQYNLTLCNI